MEARQDQLQLARIVVDVTNGEDALLRCRELLGIHRDQVLFQVKAPVSHRTQLHGQPEERQHGVAGNIELAFLALHGHTAQHTIVALQRCYLADVQVHLARCHQFAHLVDAVGCGTEVITAMQQRHGLCQRLQVDHPVQRRVTASDDQDVLVAKIFHPLHRIEHRRAFKIVDPRDRRLFRLEAAATGSNHHHLAVELQPAIGFQLEALIRQLLQRGHHLVVVVRRVERSCLLKQPVGKFLPGHDRQCRNVVDRLFRIKLGTLAARLVQNVDDVALQIQQTQFEDRKQAARTCAHNHHIGFDRLFRHRRILLRLFRNFTAAGARAVRSELLFRHLHHQSVNVVGHADLA